jgi:hypothetical protein
MRVQVYRNLHKDCWSVKQGGKDEPQPFGRLYKNQFQFDKSQEHYWEVI